jgi:hypothetical protein
MLSPNGPKQDLADEGHGRPNHLSKLQDQPYFSVHLATYVSMVSPDVQPHLRKTGLDQNIKQIFIWGIIVTSWQIKFGLASKNKKHKFS